MNYVTRDDINDRREDVADLLPGIHATCTYNRKTRTVCLHYSKTDERKVRSNMQSEGEGMGAGACGWRSGARARRLIHKISV